jgi:hypothetical protein
MVKSKKILEGETIQNDDSIYILKKMEEFIEKYCSHKYITDWIDINPEKGMTIEYCEVCETTVKELQ